jgi:hypothetical protein
LKNNEFQAIEMLKNSVYAVMRLNESLLLNDRKEFKVAHTQTEVDKPVLATFLKQLIADLESFDGGDFEKEEIEEELQNYSESELLNLDIEKFKGPDNNSLQLKEVMFSFFEYAKQKAISLSVRENERKENSRNEDKSNKTNHNIEGNSVDLKSDELLEHKKNKSKDAKIDSNGQNIEAKDTTRSVVIDMHDMKARYNRRESNATDEKALMNITEDKSVLTDELGAVRLNSSPFDEQIIRDNTLDFYSLLKKHEDIDETGLLRNVKERTKYMIPIMTENEDSVISASPSAKRLKTTSNVSTKKEITKRSRSPK